MWMALGLAALYGGLGILLLTLGYKIFDWVETNINFSDEIKKGNMAAAIVVAGVIISVAYIVGSAVGG